MKEIEENILNLFRKNPEAELSTTDIVMKLYPDEFNNYINPDFPDKELLKKIKRKKAKLHRRILYYLNKLVQEGILKVARHIEKGEKVFSLSIEHGDLFIEKKERKFIITKRKIVIAPLDSYEREKIIYRIDPSSWITKVDSLIYDLNDLKDLKNVYYNTVNLFNYVNDVVHLVNFENFIEESPEENIMNFLQKVNNEAREFSRRVSIAIDISKIRNEIKFFKFFENFAKLGLDDIKILLELTPKELHTNYSLFRKIIEEFSKNKVKINIKNKDKISSPCIIGRAGIYTFKEKEWLRFKEGIENSTVVCSNLSLLIDIDRFKQSNNLYDLRKVIMNSAKVMLNASSIARRNLNEYFKPLMRLAKHNIFEIHNNYIRFWNYDWRDETIYDLIKTSKNLVEDFCMIEDTIFKSCGIPLRFKIIFSSSFRTFSSELSNRSYYKKSIRSFDDLLSEDTKNFLIAREKFIKLFDFCDRVRFFRSGKINADEIIYEFNHLLNNYEIPIFCYDFEQMKGDKKLIEFV